MEFCLSALSFVESVVEMCRVDVVCGDCEKGKRDVALYVARRPDQSPIKTIIFKALFGVWPRSSDVKRTISNNKYWVLQHIFSRTKSSKHSDFLEPFHRRGGVVRWECFDFSFFCFIISSWTTFMSTVMSSIAHCVKSSWSNGTTYIDVFYRPSASSLKPEEATENTEEETAFPCCGNFSSHNRRRILHGKDTLWNCISFKDRG